MKKKVKKFEEFACQFKNEADCAEEIGEDGLKLEEVEEEYFEGED
jgi:hypothetical protein